MTQYLVCHIPTNDAGPIRRLHRGGHDPWIPTYHEEIVFRGQKRLTEKPLFPGYCFIRYTHQWRCAASVDGVRILGRRTDDGLDPHKLEQEDIDRIAAYEPAMEPDTTGFEAGDIVQIIAGGDDDSVTGLFGIYHGILSKGERSVIEVDFFSGRRKMKIPTHRLAHASARRPLRAQTA